MRTGGGDQTTNLLIGGRPALPLTHSHLTCHCLFLSQVKQHKTKESFGHALIPLTKKEYMWFYRLIYKRKYYPCVDCPLVFTNSNGGPFHENLTTFQDCWESFGFPGRPTFSLKQSSISTCDFSFSFYSLLKTLSLFWTLINCSLLAMLLTGT